ncbi:hypothetical protein [Methanospirillum lacunae]|uniref:Uncharacterized protein n=1 Tax=Methanospirillum lacunae TaxID=668570 RepID=A0A2V2N3E2_9EURY|nr:hypothetical protein [Methanospirillum lacunae]PWR72226.1 hypothetical protein DK846_09610 [Methanospirillum lacunae]
MNLDVEEWTARIEKKSSAKIISYSRTLEKGPAFSAGVKCNVLQIGALHTVTLFSIPSHPSEDIISDIFAHSSSSGASAAVLISPSGGHVFFSDDTDADFFGLINLCKPPGLSDESLHTEKIQFKNQAEALSRHLIEIRKDLSSWLYRKDGETPGSTRELTIQTLINRVILTRIFQSCERGERTEYGSLMDALSSFASTVPVLDSYDIRTRILDEETTNEVNRLASLPVKDLKNIRLSWISPEDWSSAFAMYLTSLPREPHKKKASSDEDEQEGCRAVLKSGVGKLIAGALSRDESLVGSFWDPAGGCGEIVATMLRRIRIVLNKDGRDTITGRLIAAGDMVHANDASPIYVAMIRFVIASWILSGECTDPSLIRTPLWYPFLSLDRQIRTGSPLYDERAYEEFASVQEGYPILRHLHPLPVKEFAQRKPFSLIISCPEGKSPGGPPEIARYLTRRFFSYTGGTDRGALYTELAREMLAPDGRAIIFLRKNWLSESSYRGFRQWIAHTSGVTIVVPEDEHGKGDADCLSAVILHSVPEKTHTVFRFPTGMSEPISGIRKYQIFPEYHHKDDGWSLHDPWETTMMERLSHGTMTLSEYLFDELYYGIAGYQIRNRADFWISLTWKGSDLFVGRGKTPEPNAEVIIPGDDPYLVALLHSSIARWYFKTSIRRSIVSPDLMNLIRNLPVRVIDHYSPEEKLISERIGVTASRLEMLGKRREICHAWHDINRIERQITTTQEEMDYLINILYGISPKDCSEIRQRMKTDGTFDIQNTGFQIR